MNQQQVLPGRALRRQAENVHLEAYVYLRRGLQELAMCREILGGRRRLQRTFVRRWTRKADEDDVLIDAALKDGHAMRRALEMLQALIEIYERERGYPQMGDLTPAPVRLIDGPDLHAGTVFPLSDDEALLVADLPAFGGWLRATGGATGKVGAERTIGTYLYRVRLFWRYCQGQGDTAATATRDMAEAFFAGRRLDGVRGQHSDLQALRHYYAWLKREGRRADDPTADIHAARPQPVPTRPLMDDELMALIGACEHERDKVLFMVLAATGCRISELAAMQREDVDWASGIIKIIGKGAKERLVRIPCDVLDRLRAFCGNVDPSGQPWPNEADLAR